MARRFPLETRKSLKDMLRTPHPARRPAVALAAVMILAAGCPHRSPLWSPDGKRLLVLAGEKGEEVDQPASSLWVIDVEEGAATRLPPPADGFRHLAAVWLDASRFAVAAGRWKDEQIEEGSEAFWTRSVSGEGWSKLDAPPPSGARATRRLPVVIDATPAAGRPGRALVYPTGAEKVVAVSLETGKTLIELEPAEVVGPGPRGGFLIYRQSASGTDVIAYGKDLEPLWTRSFGDLRAEIAAKLGKKPVEVVFNDASTSDLPAASPASRVGLTLVFADIGWKEGIPGFYARLDAADGKVIDAAGAKCLSGTPAGTGDAVWCVTAPGSKDASPALRRLDLATGETRASTALEGARRDTVHGYSLDPSGKRIAVSIAGDAREVRIFDADLGRPTTIRLE